MATGIFNGLTPAVSSTGKPYSKMSWTPDGRGPANENLWPGPLLKTAQELRPGDRIDVSKIQKGNYWNVSGIRKEAGGEGAPPPPPAAPHPTAQADPTASWGKAAHDSPFTKPKSPEEQHAIARAVALDKAVNLVGVFVTGDKYKKSTTPDILWREVDKYTQLMFDYLVGNRQITELASDVTAVAAVDPDFDQNGTFTE
jgi:hypothetical protein